MHLPDKRERIEIYISVHLLSQMGVVRFKNRYVIMLTSERSVTHHIYNRYIGPSCHSLECKPRFIFIGSTNRLINGVDTHASLFLNICLLVSSFLFVFNIIMLWGFLLRRVCVWGGGGGGKGRACVCECVSSSVCVCVCARARARARTNKSHHVLITYFQE